MGKILDFLASRIAEKRSRVDDPQHWIVRLTQALGSQAGVVVTPATAMAQSAVFACVRVISETIGSLPLKIYEKQPDGGKIEAVNHPLYSILHDSPNQWQTSLEYFETAAGHLCLRGNSYSFKQLSRGNRLQALVPLNPDRMELRVDGTSAVPVFTYHYRGDGLEADQDFSRDEIWHLKGLSSDGYSGLSVLSAASNSVGLSIAAEKHGSKYFANGARPSVVAKYPGKLSETASARLRSSLAESISGDNVFKVLLLEEGLDFASIGINNVDSQFLETRQFQIEEIARIFRVPSVLIGHPDKTMTYASVEQLLLAFVVHCIRPWAARIEKSINKNLLNGDKKYFAEFNLEGLLRGDTKSRYDAYASALQNTWMTRNEVRLKENLNPVPDGDKFENPAITTKTSTETPVKTVTE